MKLKNKPAIKKSKKLSSFWKLCANTWQELSAFWRPLGGVVAIYGLLYFIFVLGFNVSFSYKDIADSISLQLGGNANWFALKSLTVLNLFSSNNSSDSGAIVQFLLFVIATLALIWTLRQLRTLKHIRMRDAYFEGTSRIVPTIIVIVLLLVTFLPAAIGSAVFSVAQVGGTIGLIIGGLVGLALFILSFYWLCAWLPALYIVSLPNGTPIKAIRSASKLTKKHRFWMLRNVILFIIVTASMIFLIMLLFVSIFSVASVIAAYVASFVIFGIAQVFLFVMYRDLLDES